MRIGVVPWASVAGLADDRHEVAGLVEVGEELQAGVGGLVDVAAGADRPAAKTPWIAWLEARGSPARATAFL